MAKVSSRLGRGLSTLVAPHDTRHLLSAPEQPSAASSNPVRELPLNEITQNPRQPRTTFNEATLAELADSIRANGVLQPVIVRSIRDHKYELVAGERRWRAAKLAGLKAIPAIVRELSDVAAFATALVENLQREDLGPLERAAAYQHYLDSFGGTIEDLASRLSESRANVANYLRLLKLRPEICYMLGTGELSMGHARAIAGIDDQHRQLAIAKLAARRNLSVRQVEAMAQAATQSATPPPVAATPAAPQRHHIDAIEQALSKTMGLPIRLHPGRKKNSGRVIIYYHNLAEFDRIAEKLGGTADLE